MTDNNENPPTEPRRPRYLPPLKPGQKKPRDTYRPPSPPKLPRQYEPRDSLLSFSAQGRLGRLSFLAALLGMALFVGILGSAFILVGVLVIPGLLGHLSSAGNNPFGFGLGATVFIAIFSLACFYFTTVLTIRRLHDLNLSGWWVLLSFVPSMISGTLSWVIGSHILSWIAVGIGDLFWLFLVLAPGTKEGNRFGEPRRTSFWENVFGVLSLVGMIWVLADGEYEQYFPATQHPTDTTLTTLSNTANPATSGKYQAPYPFTAQELWAKILKVTALSDGTLSKAQIEGVFGATMQSMTNPLTKGIMFQTQGGEDWYFSLVFDPNDMFGGNTSDFGFDWIGHDAYGEDPPVGMCINVNDIKPSLLGQGWVLQKPEDDPVVPSDSYQKGESTLLIAFNSDKCMRKLFLTTPARPNSAS